MHGKLIRGGISTPTIHTPRSRAALASPWPSGSSAGGAPWEPSTSPKGIPQMGGLLAQGGNPTAAHISPRKHTPSISHGEARITAFSLAKQQISDLEKAPERGYSYCHKPELVKQN